MKITIKKRDLEITFQDNWYSYFDSEEIQFILYLIARINKIKLKNKNEVK